MASLADLALLLPIFAVGAGLIGYGLLALGQLLRIRRGAGTPATDASRALVSLEGTAVDVDDATVTSPLTGREALWYSYRVDTHGGDLTRPDWTPVAEGRDGRVFGVETGGDTVRVDPDGADVELDPIDEVDVVADPADVADLRSVAATVTVDEAAESVDVGVATLDAGERYRLLERRIEVGDALAVTGGATVNAAGGPGVLLRASTDGGLLARFLGVPFVVASPRGADASEQLRGRVLIGLVVGLPLVMLSLVYLFPP